MKLEGRDDFIPEGMKFSDFTIGAEFITGAGRWRVTDMGSRVVVAIQIEGRSTADLARPPYMVAEVVFDEYDFGGCSPVHKTTG